MISPNDKLINQGHACSPINEWTTSVLTKLKADLQLQFIS